MCVCVFECVCEYANQPAGNLVKAPWGQSVLGLQWKPARRCAQGVAKGGSQVQTEDRQTSRRIDRQTDKDTDRQQTSDNSTKSTLISYLNIVEAAQREMQQEEEEDD